MTMRVLDLADDLFMKKDLVAAMMLRGCRLAAKHGAAAMKEIAEAKYLAAEMSYEVADKALQVLGGIGYTNKYPVESFLRVARLGRIASGTSEIMQYIVQRDTYKEILGKKEPIS